jgi:hypothetical protein
MMTCFLLRVTAFSMQSRRYGCFIFIFTQTNAQSFTGAKQGACLH